MGTTFWGKPCVDEKRNPVNVNRLVVLLALFLGFPASLLSQDRADETITDIQQLSPSDRRLIRSAIYQSRLRDRSSDQALRVLSKFAPLDRPGIFEAHEALVQRELAKREKLNRSDGTDNDIPDFEYLDKHLKHMRALRPDSSVIELSEKRYEFETRYLYNEGKQKAFRAASRAWMEDPLQYKHMIDHYERILNLEFAGVFRDKMESQLEQLVKDAMTEPEIKKMANRQVNAALTPRRKKLVESILHFFGKFDPDKGVRLLQQLQTNPNYSAGCQEALESLAFEKLKSAYEKVKNSKRPEHQIVQLKYLEQAYKLPRSDRRQLEASKHLTDIVFEGGEFADQAADIFPAIQNSNFNDIARQPHELRTYIAQKHYEKKNYNEVLKWADRRLGGRDDTLAIWCFANIKAENGDVKDAFEEIKHHQLERHPYRPYRPNTVDLDLVKAKGFLLVENGFELLAFDLLKFYCAQFPEDKEAKEYFFRCIRRIEAESK